MSKADRRIYKGLEIMKMISEGKISDHQRFNFENNNWDGEVEYDNGTLYWLIYDEKWNLEEKRNLFDMFNIQSTMVADFEFLDNQPEEIEEKNLYYVVCESDFNNMKIVTLLNEFFRENNRAIDELTRAVNQIRKEKE